MSDNEEQYSRLRSSRSDRPQTRSRKHADPQDAKRPIQDESSSDDEPLISESSVVIDMNQLQIRASEADDDPRVKDAADKMKANLKECQWSLTEQYLDSEEASRRYQECIDQITFNDGQFRYLPKTVMFGFWML